MLVCVCVCVRARACAQLCPAHCDPVDYSLLCPWDSPSKTTGVGCRFLLWGIFLTQGWNLHLLYWQADSLPLEPSGKPWKAETFAYFVVSQPLKQSSPYRGSINICYMVSGANCRGGTADWRSGIRKYFELINLCERKWKCSSFSPVWLFATPWTLAPQAPPSMGFSRQEYWSGLPFPSPGDLPNPGIKPKSPTLQADSLLSEPPSNDNDLVILFHTSMLLL